MARILVVDDITGVRKTVVAVLKRLGHTVAEAPNGRVAKEVVTKAEFDLVVTDILMPDRDGSALIADLRRLDPAPRIIAMSGGGSLVRTEDALIYARQAADAVLEKPFDGAELARVINRVLQEVPHAAA